MICSNFTGLVCTRSGFKKLNTGRDRDRKHFHRISLDGNGISKIPRDAYGIIPLSSGIPRVFHNAGINLEESPGINAGKVKNSVVVC